MYPRIKYRFSSISSETRRGQIKRLLNVAISLYERCSHGSGGAQVSQNPVSQAVRSEFGFFGPSGRVLKECVSLFSPIEYQGKFRDSRLQELHYGAAGRCESRQGYPVPWR